MSGYVSESEQVDDYSHIFICQDSQKYTCDTHFEDENKQCRTTYHKEAAKNLCQEHPSGIATASDTVTHDNISGSCKQTKTHDQQI